MRRAQNLLWLLLLPALLCGPAAGAPAGDGHARLALPPASLAQWYKPANKRQVWLHTMFDLREAMQAAEHYTAAGDRERAQRWAEAFRELYHRLPEMVPEWRDELEPAAAEALVQAAARGDESALSTALHHLGTTCNGCHNEYQAVTAAIYRSPDYAGIEVPFADGAQPFDEAMERLARTLNRFKIAFKDGLPNAAGAAAADLGEELDALGATCAGCHRDAAPRERILGAHTRELLTRLPAVLETGDRAQVGRTLGELAVTTCARCHAVHRTLSGLRGQLVP